MNRKCVVIKLEKYNRPLKISKKDKLYKVAHEYRVWGAGYRECIHFGISLTDSQYLLAV